MNAKELIEQLSKLTNPEDYQIYIEYDGPDTWTTLEAEYLEIHEAYIVICDKDH